MQPYQFNVTRWISRRLCSQQSGFRSKTISSWLHLDLPLLWGLLILISFGLVILYSASNQDIDTLRQQSLRFLFTFGILLIFAQIPPEKYKLWTPWFFVIGCLLLVSVLLFGYIAKGGQRWLDLKIFRFQPSEIMKLVVPMMIAWYMSHNAIPPKYSVLGLATAMSVVPFVLVAKQPDLGTAILILVGGMFVVLLAGIRWRLIIGLVALGAACLPVLWHFLHTYQRQRILTLFDPESDPLGTGYQIIQSKIAIGSGGLFGKGWLNGTQSQLQFLPEHATDFIFAVCGEEFGLAGALVLIGLYLTIVGRGLYISSQAQDTFTRLLAGSISLTLCFSVFVNIGMVSGMLPVVGIPLPFVSYGGTSMLTLMASFGVLMSIHTHRKLVTT